MKRVTPYDRDNPTALRLITAPVASPKISVCRSADIVSDKRGVAHDGPGGPEAGRPVRQAGGSDQSSASAEMIVTVSQAPSTTCLMAKGAVMLPYSSKSMGPTKPW